MEKIGIYGVGQAGRMALKWLPSTMEPRCFIDSDRSKQGLTVDGLPVMSLNSALDMDLQAILIAVLNKSSMEEIRTSIEETGFGGKVLSIDGVREILDIRLSALRLMASEIKKRGVEGAVSEFGVYRGDFAKELNRLFPERKLFLFDTFNGFDEGDMEAEREKTGENRFRDFSKTNIELVREVLPYPEQAVFIEGHFPESLSGFGARKEDSGLEAVSDSVGQDADSRRPSSTPEEEPLSYALVSLDTDLYLPTKEGLSYFYPRLNPGGVILIHDYTSSQFPGVSNAVDEFCGENGLFIIPLMDLHGSAVLLRS